MNPKGRIAAAVGAGVVLIAGAFALVAAGRDGGGDVRADDTTTTSSTTTTVAAETTTTVDLLPESTTTSTTRPAGTTTTTAAPLPVVGSSGAVLQAGASAAARKMEAEDCESLGDEAWTVTGCGFATIKGGGTRVWLVQKGPVKGTRAYVFGPGQSPGSWRVVLEARDDDGTRWKAGGVTARVVDLSGDKADDIVFGFRAASGDGLALDVVEGPSTTVTAHRDLAGGRARVSAGQWDTWALLSSGRYQHDIIRWQDNAWRIVLREETAAADVPPSQF